MKGGAYACVKLNVSANTPSPVLPQSSVQKGEGGGYFWELTDYSSDMNTDINQHVKTGGGTTATNTYKQQYLQTPYLPGNSSLNVTTTLLVTGI